MKIAHEMRYWLFGCHATNENEHGKVYCTLGRKHDVLHEAWTCSCAGDGRCSDDVSTPVATWADEAASV
jgi:hypothetical protein